MSRDKHPEPDMILTATTIAAAFAPHRAEMKASFVSRSENILAALVSRFGPTIRHIGKGSALDAYFNMVRAVRPMLDKKGLSSFGEIGKLTATFCPEKLEAGAERFAEATVDAIIEKVLAKVGNLSGARLEDVRPNSFRLVGKHGEKSVIISQRMILNVSKLGLLFNQFPATIKVDGKRISAVNFSKLGPAPVVASQED